MLEFVASEYFSFDKDVYILCKVILDQAKTEETRDKHLLWAGVYPQIPYNDSKFRQLNHKLFNALKLFLIHETFKREDVLNHRLLALSAEERKLSELKNGLTRKSDTLLEDNLLVSVSNLIDLSMSEYSIYSIQDDVNKIKTYSSLNIQDRMIQMKHLAFYSHQIFMIKLYLVAYIHKAVSNTEMVIKASDIQHSKSSGGEIPLYDLYLSIFEIYEGNFSSDKVFETIDLLSTFENENNEDIKFAYTAILNHLVRERNKGQNVDNELFKLCLFGLNSNLELEGGHLRSTSYINIVILALRLGNLDYALELAEDYADLLEATERNSAYHFAKANVLLYMKKFEEMIDLLRDVKFDTTSINLNSRLLQIMAFYELDEYEVLTSVIQAFKVFLRRSRKISKVRKQNFVDFCDSVYNLGIGTERAEHQRIERAREILSNNHAIPGSWWLKEKIEEAQELLGISASPDL